jgi:chromodomain-helicase-DNA-binding protein 1
MSSTSHTYILTGDRTFTINHHWPRPGVTVAAVKGMYNKMLSSEKPAVSAAPTNGQKNGA